MNTADDGASRRWADLSPFQKYLRDNPDQYDPKDPFKRPWVTGRRPWQYRDRPKFARMPDAIMEDGTMVDFKVTSKIVDMDFAEVEKRLMAWYEYEAGEKFQLAIMEGLQTVEARTRLLNSRRQLP